MRKPKPVVWALGHLEARSGSENVAIFWINTRAQSGGLRLLNKTEPWRSGSGVRKQSSANLAQTQPWTWEEGRSECFRAWASIQRPRSQGAVDVHMAVWCGDLSSTAETALSHCAHANVNMTRPAVHQSSPASSPSRLRWTAALLSSS
jgi:hypothetical protein